MVNEDDDESGTYPIKFYDRGKWWEEYEVDGILYYRQLPSQPNHDTLTNKVCKAGYFVLVAATLICGALAVFS